MSSIPQFPSSPRLSRFSSRGIYSVSNSRTQIHPATQQNQCRSDPGRNTFSSLYVGSSGSINQFSSPSSHPVLCSCSQDQGYNPFYTPQTSSSSLNNKRISGSPRIQTKLQFSRPMPSQHSVSLDDLGRSLPLYSQSDQALSCVDLPAETSWSAEPQPEILDPPLQFYTEHTMLSTTEPTSWSRTKVNYKSGVYAHWWMNTSLKPIREEGFESGNLTQL